MIRGSLLAPNMVQLASNFVSMLNTQGIHIDYLVSRLVFWSN